MGSYCKEIAIDFVSRKGGFGFAHGVGVFPMEALFFLFFLNELMWRRQERGKKDLTKFYFFNDGIRIVIQKKKKKRWG